MKRPVLFILLLMLLLTACSEREAPPVSIDAVTAAIETTMAETSSAETAVTETASAAVTTEADTTASETDAEITVPLEIPAPIPREVKILTGAAIPSEEHILQAYTYAAEIWDTLHISTLPVFGGAQYVRDGWHPVRDYGTMADLAARLRESFTEELTESLLRELSARYREIGGRLYAILGDRGTNVRAGESRISVEPADASTIRVTRTTMVLDMLYHEGREYFFYPAAASELTLSLVYEDGRWVFSNFAVVDDLTDFKSGGGVPFAHAKEVAAAFVDAENASGVTMPEGYSASRYMKFYRENPDGTATFTMNIDVLHSEQHRSIDYEYTAVQNAAGEWEIVDFVAPEIEEE